MKGTCTFYAIVDGVIVRYDPFILEPRWVAAALIWYPWQEEGLATQVVKAAEETDGILVIDTLTPWETGKIVEFRKR